jgi:oxygen-dependent protoporphyrinogen oxidase
MRVVVIGGGISGLATAFYVRRARPDVEVFVLEAAQRLGGTMLTREINGFRFEGGSNGFLSNKPHTLDLVRDSGAQPLLLPSNDAARIRYIYSDALHRLPESPPAFLATPLLSWRAKLRVLGEIFTPARRDITDESLRDFGYRRVGKEFTDTFLDPMSAGIYASTAAKLSVHAAFPAVVRLEREYGGLFKGMIKRRKRRAGPGGRLMSFHGGVGTFVDHLGEVLGETVRTGIKVRSLRRGTEGYILLTTDGELTADAVVLSTPAYAAARMLRHLDDELAYWLGQVGYTPIAVVGFGYRDLAHPLKGFGLLTTAASQQEVLGVLWDSSIFPDRAPPGKKLVRVMIGGQRNSELAMRSEEELIDIARRGLTHTMGVTENPAVTFVKRWRRGIPNYRLGHLANVERIFARVAGQWPGLYLNSNAYWGIGLNDCVGNAKRCAAAIARREPWRGGPLLEP